MYVNSNVKTNTQAGFSLIELMVVVAIIGLLAAIAVPQFTKFQNRAKQSEVQTHLSGVYTAEQAFNAQWGGYYGAFDAVGYAVAATTIRYDCGFTAVGALPGGAPAGTVGDFKFDVGPVCTGGTVACTGTTDVSAYAAGAGSGTPTNIAMLLSCGAKFANGPGTVDTWTINQGQTIVNTIVGI